MVRLVCGLDVLVPYYWAVTMAFYLANRLFVPISVVWCNIIFILVNFFFFNFYTVII